jgi:hypothetical protein
MGRQREDLNLYPQQEVAKVIGCITSKQKTWEDLFEVLVKFCSKDYQHSKDTCKEWGVAPLYLVIASMLWFEHPLLVREGRCGSYVSMEIDVVRAELHRWDLAMPMKNPQILSTGGVERIARDVERISF